MFWYEVRQALLRALRRGRVDGDRLASALGDLTELRMEADAGHHQSRVFSLAERHGPSFCDGCHLETALRHRGALAAPDRKRLAAARAERVPVVPG